MIAPVVIELNTLDLIEYRNRGWLRYALHRISRNKVFGRAKGFVALSGEIAFNSANKKYGKPVSVISNGINLDKYQPFPAPKNSRPHLVYMGTPGNQWQGVEKLIQMAILCPDYLIELIGVDVTSIVSDIPENVKIYKFMSENDYLPILSRADVAVGTLSLYRKGMNEASPLKVREYLAYGIPVIIAYHDSDFMPVNVDFILQLPNSAENVLECINEIKAFVSKQKGKRVDPEAVRPRIHNVCKEKERLRYFEKLLATKLTRCN